MEPLLNKKDVAAILNVSITTVNRLVHTKKIEYLKVGGRVLFMRESVEKFILGCVVGDER